MSALDNIEAIVSEMEPSALELHPDSWLRVNPKWRIVAKTFVRMLSEESVLARLAGAQTMSDLKAILFVDHYLGRVQYGRFREHIQTLLANPDVPISVIERYAALSYAYEAIWQTEEPDAKSALYSVDSAAVQLGFSAEDIYDGILDGKIEADIYLTWTEIARLLEEKFQA